MYYQLTRIESPKYDEKSPEALTSKALEGFVSKENSNPISFPDLDLKISSVAFVYK